MSEKIEGGYVGSNITGNAKTATNLQGGALGATPYQTASDTTVFLAGNTTTTKKVLKQTGNGTVSADPIWEQASVNECSDYTSGTWTPVDASGAGLTFVAVSARYIKIGNMVRIWAYFFYPVQSDATTAKIGGLPFTIGNFDANIGGIGGSSNNATFGRAYYLNKNATTAQPVTASMGSVTNANMSDVACAIGLTYLIS